MISPAGKDHLSRQWPFLAAAIKSVRPFFESRHVRGQDWDAKLEGLSFGDIRKRHRWRIASHYEPDDGGETFYLQYNQGSDNSQDWRTKLAISGSGDPHLATTFDSGHFYVDTQADGTDHVFIKRPAPNVDLALGNAPSVRYPANIIEFNRDHFYFVNQGPGGGPGTGNRMRVELAKNFAEASDVGARYVHAQTVPSKEWQVVHNLGNSDLIQEVQDSNQQVIQADTVDFSNPLTAYFYFSDAITGRAIISSGTLGETFVGVDNIGVDVTDGANTYLAAQELNFASTHFYLSSDLAGNPVVNFIPSSVSTIVVDDGVSLYDSADGVTFNNAQFYLSAGTPATRPVVNLKTTALPFGTSRDSGLLSITAGGMVTWAHGLGVEPDLVIVKLQCVVADGTFSIGDVVFLGTCMDNNGSFTTNRSTNVRVDTTNVYVTNTAGIIINAKTGGAHFSITTASWNYRVKALVL